LNSFVLIVDLGLKLGYRSLKATNQSSETRLLGFRALLFCSDLIGQPIST
jgi:hypothetical protein